MSAVVGGIGPVAPGGPGSSVSAAQAKQLGQAFEQMLVNELAQQLAATAGSGDGSDSGDGSGSADGSGTAAGGLMGSDPASTAYSQLIPSALTSSLMSAGGTGIAQEIAAALDPGLGAKR